jgi:magnesium-transporting ATPase (P-type)
MTALRSKPGSVTTFIMPYCLADGSRAAPSTGNRSPRRDASLPEEDHSWNREKLLRKYNHLSEEGYITLAVAYKECKNNCIKTRDEGGLIFQGFLTFLDPPKKTAGTSMQQLKALNVEVKILTGDNHIVAKKICDELKARNL